MTHYLAKEFPKLVKNYAMDALGTRFGIADGSKDAALGFLDAARNSTPSVHDAVDLGQTVSLESRNLIGTSLVYDGHVLHLAIFAKENGDERMSLQSPRMRRRHLY